MNYEKIKQTLHEMYGHLPPLSRDNDAWHDFEAEYVRHMVEVGAPIAQIALELKRSDCDVYHQPQVMQLRVKEPKPANYIPSSPTTSHRIGSRYLSLYWRFWSDIKNEEDA